jgi:acyl transferase domain-containing protein
MKAVLCLQHNKIPGQLHIERLNPSIKLENTPFYVPLENQSWPRTSQPRYAGVSSFGLSGTNTHVIVEDPPDRPPRTLPGGPQLLVLSARSAPALKQLVDSYREYLESDASEGVEVADICYTAGVRRSHHSYRVAVVGSTRRELAERLKALGEKDFGKPPVLAGLPERLAMVFSGQGSQWAGMATDLLESQPVFASRFAECDAIFSRLSGISLLEQLRAGRKDSLLDDTNVAQPAIFAVQAGLLALYESWGIRPDAVIGHSAGEAAAAYAAGIFSLEDALKIMYHRSRLMQRATGLGRMAAVGLPGPETERAPGSRRR